MTAAPGAEPRAAFDQRLGALRPKLHRYCARMTGSVIDGEDVVQEALVKALEAFSRAGPIINLEGWLFRIAHHAALDHLRRRARHAAMATGEDAEMIADPADPIGDRALAAMGLRIFSRLPTAQRSSVILKDVLGYSLDEIGAMTDSSLPAVKAALHRGRARLRALALEPEDAPPPLLPAADRARLIAYVDRFNARDFDAVRQMLADEVRLELVNKQRLAGRSEVSHYWHNYAQARDWHCRPGFVDERPAVLVCQPDAPAARPRYFILLGWQGDGVATIRDFRYARYAIDDARLVFLSNP
jgi:RNA polymerase sigma-70 factor, ECF subfamily